MGIEGGRTGLRRILAAKLGKARKRGCSANPPGLLRRGGRCESVIWIRADVSTPHDGSQERQDARLLASGALGASRPPSGAGDGGAAWRARRAGTGAGRRSALRITGREEQYELFEAPAGRSEPVAVRLDHIRLERARRFGDVWLGWRLWRALALDRFCEDRPWSKAASGRRGRRSRRSW